MFCQLCELQEYGLASIGISDEQDREEAQAAPKRVFRLIMIASSCRSSFPVPCIGDGGWRRLPN